MELFVTSGGNIPSNPIIFENDTYLDGVSEVGIKYSTSGGSYYTKAHSISDGIRFNGLNGGYSDAIYLDGLDLSKYKGKRLIFNISVNGSGAVITKTFNITASSKRVVCGLGTVNSGGWQYPYAVGLTSEEFPEYAVTSNSDIYSGSQTAGSYTNPVLRVRKIYIDN